jgi:hypothetical protein
MGTSLAVMVFTLFIGGGLLAAGMAFILDKRVREHGK